MLAKIKSDPVTTVSALVAAACGWLSQQPELAGHPTGKQILQVVGAAAVAIFGYFAKDASAPK